MRSWVTPRVTRNQDGHSSASEHSSRSATRTTPPLKRSRLTPDEPQIATRSATPHTQAMAAEGVVAATTPFASGARSSSSVSFDATATLDFLARGARRRDSSG